MSYAQCKKCGEAFDTEKMEHSRVDIYDITVPMLAGAVPRGWVADGGYLCKECGAALKQWFEEDALL